MTKKSTNQPTITQYQQETPSTINRSPPLSTMAKTSRKIKRKNRTKVKKSSKTKSKLIRPKDPIENVSTPQMVKLENHQDDEIQHQTEDHSTDEMEPDPISLTIIRKAMKVKHEHLADKLIRKSPRQLNKAQKLDLKRKLMRQ